MEEHVWKEKQMTNEDFQIKNATYVTKLYAMLPYLKGCSIFKKNGS